MRQHLAGWQQFSKSLRAQAEFLLAWTEGDFERCRKLSQAGVESKKFKESGHWDQHRLQLTLAMTLRHDGDYVRAEEILLSALAPCESDEMFLYREMAFRPEHALNLATLGDLEHAQAEISRCSEILAASEDWRGLAGHFHSAAGYCSAATGAQPESEQHFAAAIETFERLSLPWSEADTFQLWGQALVAARQPRSANEKFDAAIEIYRRIGGGVRWIERVETVRRAQSTPRPLPGDSIVQQEQAKNEGLFRSEGDIWTITYEDQTLRLKDFKGLKYIARLLQHPGEEFPAASLVTAVDWPNGTEDSEAGAELGAMTREQLAERNLRAGAPEDAGAMLDAQATAAYRHRLEELREELEEAKEFRNPKRIAKAEDEIEALGKELSRAIGRGGRHRRDGSTSERARLSVTSAIKVAIERVAQKHSRLAAHLTASIRTGTYCCYRPDPRSDTAWHF